MYACCANVDKFQVLLHLSQWDFSVNMTACSRSAPITPRHLAINEFPEFEFSKGNDILLKTLAPQNENKESGLY